MHELQGRQSAIRIFDGVQHVFRGAAKRCMLPGGSYQGGGPPQNGRKLLEYSSYP